MPCNQFLTWLQEFPSLVAAKHEFLQKERTKIELIKAKRALRLQAIEISEQMFSFDKGLDCRDDGLRTMFSMIWRKALLS
jgi:hypothetical protein